ncbi:hypothetical protein B0T19DRAFT_51505 [Cercophora scortea]|uniref:Uncharacterized protein n=1 Tax=Cercophora scortea TaxID=314031 RepID=A0AAE0MLQ4_9PEZI|nr:hypothetical protein B0T19DRAFT_51505 [Cercophora scortea]
MEVSHGYLYSASRKAVLYVVRERDGVGEKKKYLSRRCSGLGREHQLWMLMRQSFFELQKWTRLRAVGSLPCHAGACVLRELEKAARESGVTREPFRTLQKSRVPMAEARSIFQEVLSIVWRRATRRHMGFWVPVSPVASRGDQVSFSGNGQKGGPRLGDTIQKSTLEPLHNGIMPVSIPLPGPASAQLPTLAKAGSRKDQQGPDGGPSNCLWRKRQWAGGQGEGQDKGLKEKKEGAPS